MADAVGTTHHVKIGDDFYIIRQGSYTKKPAPLFGARFTSGDPDFNNLSFWQHWAQTCWVGGFGAESWTDDAMFDEGVGIDASQHEVMLLARDLGPTNRAAGNFDLDNESAIRIFTVFNGRLHLLQTEDDTHSRLYVFDDATQAWVWKYTFPARTGWMESFAGYLFFGPMGANLYRWSTSEVMDTVAKPSARTDVVRAMKVYRGHLYCGFGREIWRLKSDFTWDGSTPFYTAEAGDVNYLNQAEIHLGFLYFASRNGHILRTDGNNTFDLWAFEPHVNIWGLRSFDGRLFIGAAEELEGTTSQQTTLYQFSGAAVTELKRWGRVGYDTTPGKMRTYGRRLFFGASNLLGMGETDGFGIAMYEPVEDAFHLFASNLDTATFPPGTEGVNTTVDDVFFWKGYMFASVRGYGVFRTPWTYRDASRALATYDNTAAGALPGATNGGWYTSSDFDGGTPGLMKLWNAITVHVDLPHASTSVYVEVSADGGATWQPAGSAANALIEKTSAATRYSKTITLQDTSPGQGFRSTRLKYRITLRTTDTAYSPQLRGVVVRYLPQPEPNWMWDFTIVLSDRQELLDGSIADQDVAARIANLETALRTGNLVHFTDVDGTEWAAGTDRGVLIYDLQQRAVFVGPDSDGVIEREVRIVLLEAVEAY